MSRNTSPARHRAAVDGNIALQGLSRAARAHAAALGRPVAVAAVTSGIALSAMGTAHAGSYTDEGTTAPAAVVTSNGATAHTVVAGDTLGAISARYGVDLNAVLSVNGLSVNSIIVPGQNIVLPTAGVVAAPVQTVSVPVAAPAAVVEQVAVAAPAAVVEQVAVMAPAAVVEQVAVAAPAPVVEQVSVAAAASYAAPATGSYGAAAVAADFQLSSTGINVQSNGSKAVVAAPAGNLGGIILGSAQAQLAAGAIQDCTVLAEVALRAAGIPVGDLGPSQFLSYGSIVSSPAPGDLVVTGGHVAIYAGGGQVISSGMNGAQLTMQHPLSDLPGAQFVRVSR
ncbi:LysM peptidoglycan-binding domain-containing protein [Arthrobacter echini]|uniref:LysM peptidoglycan-binding domain-containing protein n=1 Tax=Arthrobacter echini TaxID=1529066 RepID=A0A4S5E318_9MICC|nr:LysM peptidoglycan-binding domain-containing protein [Arthrobacter echini]THJ65815.1 LysM peptidoglycan-binding domain-containing protein [Arthrobacter echini]